MVYRLVVLNICMHLPAKTAKADMNLKIKRQLKDQSGVFFVKHEEMQPENKPLPCCRWDFYTK